MFYPLRIKPLNESNIGSSSNVNGKNAHIIIEMEQSEPQILTKKKKKLKPNDDDDVDVVQFQALAGMPTKF